MDCRADKKDCFASWDVIALLILLAWSLNAGRKKARTIEDTDKNRNRYLVRAKLRT